MFFGVAVRANDDEVIDAVIEFVVIFVMYRKDFRILVVAAEFAMPQKVAPFKGTYCA